MAIYNQEELDTLNKSLNYRKVIVEEIFKDGVPTHNGTARVVNELLNSIDAQIHNNASMRLKETEMANGKEMQETIIQLMKEQNKKMIQTPTRESISEVIINPEDVIETPTFVPGEDSAYEELNADQFVSKGD